MGVTEEGGVPSFSGKGHVWKKSGVTTQVRKEAEVGTLLLSSDKSSFIAENVFKFFFMFRRQVWSTGCTFWGQAIT